jgi:hypothetical protein
MLCFLLQLGYVLHSYKKWALHLVMARVDQW